jgi:hypothetical protein
MKILIVGYGAHAKRRIIPALKKIEQISEIHLISDRDLSKDDIGEVKIFNYSELKNIDVTYDLILISNYPVKHMDLFKKVKNFGSKFIIEKPITSKLELLLKNEYDLIFQDKLVYESNAFLFHPVYQAVKDIMRSKNITKVVSSFTIPKLNKDNYRYNKELGGSSILDQGVYPISLTINLFKTNFNIKQYKVFYDEKLNIDTGGTLLAKALDGIEVELNWGINQEYKNELTILSKNKEIYFPFIFSKPENHTSSYFELGKESNKEILIGNFDQFQLMYEQVLFETKSNGDNELDELKYKYNLIKNMLDNKQELI